MCDSEHTSAVPRKFPRRVWVGIDVGKRSFQLAILPDDTDVPLLNTSLEYDKRGIASMLRQLRRYTVALIVLEATGRYERRLVTALNDTGMPIAVINPRQSNHFAKALNLMAKSDPVDAGVLAVYARHVRPVPRPIRTEEQTRLADLVVRRRQLVRMRTAELNRLDAAPSREATRSMRCVCAVLDRQINRASGLIDQLIRGVPEWEEKAALLQTVCGVGQTSSHALVAELPELGRLSRRAIASLVGVAPMNNDSGCRKGRRRTRGGRDTVRTTLYMATLSACRFNPPIRTFYRRLLNAGKDKMVAHVAAMRKLLVVLNAVVRDRAPWDCQTGVVTSRDLPSAAVSSCQAISIA